MGSGIDFNQIFGDARALALLIWPMLKVVAYACGLFFLYQGGRTLVQAGREGSPYTEESQMPWGKLATHFLVGACLLQFGWSIDNTRELLAGAGEGWRTSLTAIAPSAGGGIWDVFMKAALTWLFANGAAAVFRGFLLWHQLGAGENSNGKGDLFWRGLWHIIFGGVLMNIGGI
jgi:hypothetical protein